jgi:hypothetical protein
VIASLSREQIVNSLRTFRQRREALLHDDVATFEHHLERFLSFCAQDPLAQMVVGPLATRVVDVDAWWTAATQHEPEVKFPDDTDSEFALRLCLLRSAAAEPNRIFQIGIAHNQSKRDGWVEFFRTLIVRPFAEDLAHRLGEAANLATPEARTLQAVPLERIPSSRESKIFLSHKSVDKPLVYRYFNALKALGFDPWLDESNMPAGSNLEREVLRGFEESCCAVFFITENFRDEKYLAAEVDYAVIQKRRKDKKFAIVTLRYANAASVPGLLTPYIYKDITNDLEGFTELVRALPIEAGPIRWKSEVV